MESFNILAGDRINREMISEAIQLDRFKSIPVLITLKRIMISTSWL